ncbi:MULTISPECIES: 3-deoxy-D-arabino-heptulosonate 7-phosphate synthase [unclassified Caballeronia]|uniref:3-deoxy-D-arabino-heptulosonate 7-phosphate synthase n=1 Tax=unclassified Caballeronia TaxID=2646786 RepID=UPI00285DD93C|nr:MULTISPECIES: 3-deoxy-D-arabino-heptulosonate 7-phosphate synthase [unclassified Caballeronia]MDR5740624.1 3-deoxy-D-arabino-heptulosonate 7-phosphate synthase [Caballeronia sp. LZ016]MDR5808853.1 3-deoxy-D-arabino-heptulosonate 7-phosphate synthase [Caballeronia sp. LZ019]
MPHNASLLNRTLNAVTRRYRLPKLDVLSPDTHALSPETALALVIEQARIATAGGAAPDGPLKQRFLDSLARMIAAAIHPRTGDAVFQAMLLRHREATVRDYTSLSAQAERDRRFVHAAVNGIAHPARLQRMAPGQQREWLAELHASAASSSWERAEDDARRLLDLPDDDPIKPRVQQLLSDGALARLRALRSLEADASVRRYESLWNQQGPRSGSTAAAAQGVAAKQRGADVEALAARALDALARRLNEEEAPASYRVVTSMRVPSSIRASHEHAKTEWDAVLLRCASSPDEAAVWDVCFLIEAKASVDAASTDFARLLRGLRLLASADATADYSFETQQGVVRLNGASLHALPVEGDGVADIVLYCCDAPADEPARLLNAASRMQLLSAPASLAYASALIDEQHADPFALESVWQALLEAPRWRSVLDQYAMLRQVRELMVHTEDLLAATAH